MAKPAKKKTAAKKSPAKKKAVVAEPVVEQPIVEQSGPTQDDAQLTIADLQGMAQVIDMACRRGAFGAGEVADVGAVYQKLANFLQLINQQKQEAEGGQ